jgi:HEPN domain-containing protein
MNAFEDAQYRLKIAQGFLAEARQDVKLERWRSGVDNAQLTVENGVKAVLALLGPVGRTHNPAAPLRLALDKGRFPAEIKDQVNRLVELGEMLGPDIHMQTDYGDEVGGRTPWELFSGKDAAEALAMAEEAYGLAERIIRLIFP